MKKQFIPGQGNRNDVRLISEISERVGRDTDQTGEKFYLVECVVTHILAKEPFIYMACIECKKKVN